jgi:hypothetical protein
MLFSPVCCSAELYVFSYGSQDERGRNEEYKSKNQTVMGLYEIAYKTGKEFGLFTNRDL